MAPVHSASEGRCILFSRYFGSDSEGKNIVISIKVHFPLELSAICPLRSDIALRFRWRQKTWNIYSFYYFLSKPYDMLLKISNSWPYCDLLPAYLAIYFWPSLAFHEIQILILKFSFFLSWASPYLQCTFKEYEAFKFHIFICVEFCRQT